MRQDRDKFVKIIKENIQEGRENQFEKCKNCDNQALKYDVGSVMHYSEYAFSKNKKAGLKTIIVKGNKNTKLGQRNGFSSLDIIGLNKLYCPGYKARCRDNDPNCASMINDCTDEKKKDWMVVNCAGTCNVCITRLTTKAVRKCENKYDTTLKNPYCKLWKMFCPKEDAKKRWVHWKCWMMKNCYKTCGCPELSDDFDEKCEKCKKSKKCM